MRFLFAGYTLDTDRRELRRGADPIAVEPQVFDLLVYLVGNREHVVSKDDLIAAVWNGRIVSDSTLTSRINAARRAIGDSGQAQKLIRTIARKGFRFVGTVRAQPDARIHGRTMHWVASVCSRCVSTTRSPSLRWRCGSIRTSRWPRAITAWR